MRKLLILFTLIVCSLFTGCEELEKDYHVHFTNITDKEYNKWEPYLINGVLHDTYDNLKKLYIAMPGTGSVSGYTAFETWEEFVSDLSSHGLSQYQNIIKQELKKQKNVMILHDYPYKDTAIMVYIEDYQ